MTDNREIILKDLELQWNDHLHMRDQTWKTLQYAILFFLGVVGLEIKDIDEMFLIPAYAAVLITSLLGLFIAVHHRKRQHEKFEVIKIYEKELDLFELKQPILEQSKTGWSGRINTSIFIIVTQGGLFCLSLFLLIRLIYT